MNRQRRFSGDFTCSVWVMMSMVPAYFIKTVNPEHESCTLPLGIKSPGKSHAPKSSNNPPWDITSFYDPEISHHSTIQHKTRPWLSIMNTITDTYQFDNRHVHNAHHCTSASSVNDEHIMWSLPAWLAFGLKSKQKWTVNMGTKLLITCMQLIWWINGNCIQCRTVKHD